MASDPLTYGFSMYAIPGQSAGLVHDLDRTVGAYPGPVLSEGTVVEERIVREQLASGPRDVVFPWFLPYFDANQLQETAIMRLAYRQMLKSSVVKSAVLGKVFGVASLDLNVIPADKNNARDQEIAQHVQWMLTERLRDTLPGLIWSILVASLIDGYSVSEKVWEFEERGRYAGSWSLTKLKPKDTNNDLVLQTDEFRNVVGIMGLRYNGGREFAPAHFLIYRHLPLFDNPTGMSDLAAAYAPYWMLDTVQKLRAIGAEKHAIPFLLGKYRDATVKNSLEQALRMAKSQRWLSVPDGTAVEVINMAGASAEIFKTFRDDLVHEIYLGIQYAILQALEGQTTEGRGNSQVHQTQSQQALWFLASTIESALNDRNTGLVKDIVDLNHVVSEYPRAKLSSVDVNELAQEIQIDTALHQLGIELSKDELYDRYSRKPPESQKDSLAGGTGGPAGGAPGQNGAAKPPGLPFMEQDIFTPAQREAQPRPAQCTEEDERRRSQPAQPFRFSEPWQRYLASRRFAEE
jgi:hypothetical protein